MRSSAKGRESQANDRRNGGAGLVKFELLTRWQTWMPIIALMLGVFGGVLPETLGLVLVVSALVVTVLAAVYHVEVIAERVGEPYGTLVLAVAVTIIEVALIISLMLSTETPTPTIVRDTVFAAVMIIITGMVGLCMLTGAWQRGEQTCTRRGLSAALATLCARRAPQFHGIGLRGRVLPASIGSCRFRLARALRRVRLRADGTSLRILP